VPFIVGQVDDDGVFIGASELRRVIVGVAEDLMKERFACALYGESSMQWRRQLFLAGGERATRPVELPGLASLSPFDERNVRRTQRTRQLRRVRMAPEPATALFGVLLCLPTAPTLPK
jgi:hypothetical protein